jgi:hypothetical protein
MASLQLAAREDAGFDNHYLVQQNLIIFGDEIPARFCYAVSRQN